MRTVGGPVSTFNYPVHATVGLDLLAKNGNTIVGEHCGIESVLTFPWSCRCVGAVREFNEVAEKGRADTDSRMSKVLHDEWLGCRS